MTPTSPLGQLRLHPRVQAFAVSRLGNNSGSLSIPMASSLICTDACPT